VYLHRNVAFFVNKHITNILIISFIFIIKINVLQIRALVSAKGCEQVPMNMNNENVVREQ